MNLRASSSNLNLISSCDTAATSLDSFQCNNLLNAPKIGFLISLKNDEIPYLDLNSSENSIDESKPLNTIILNEDADTKIKKDFISDLQNCDCCQSSFNSENEVSHLTNFTNTFYNIADLCISQNNEDYNNKQISCSIISKLLNKMENKEN